MPKRNNYISWDEFFMRVAEAAAQRSKDPHTQAGACIVNSERKIVGVGYNGFPRGCSDDEFPWEPSDNFMNSKYTYVCHAEANAIINMTNLEHRSHIYVTMHPCNECAKLIIQVGIKTVIYKQHPYNDYDLNGEWIEAAKRMFKAAKVSCYALPSQ